jgi:glycine hydroxymethyltransferase
MSMIDYASQYFGADLRDVDPDIQRIIDLEEERQARRIILIPSESMAPRPVRIALGSVFNNIYAEGYPPTKMSKEDEDLLLQFDYELVSYRRYSDRRFYKGADYVNFIETLAQRRAAHLMATDKVPADHIYVNVQALSGAAANLAVYESLMNPGDTLMGMDLFQGGHLTHGSEFNFSGKRYKVASYGVDKVTEKLDYDAIMALAKQTRPKVIVAGFTSYPWAPDWAKFRAIADEVGAYLMADISHPAGLVAAGYFPTPVGYADVITFTTHKTICGPRGAVIMTTNADLAAKFDMAVFPGAQGGPHTNKFAAMAVAFKMDQTEAFRALMKRVADNAQALAAALKKHGLGLVYGGTDSHLLMVDLRPIKGKKTGNPMLAEIVVRIMELCGLVANKNTVPGDEQTAMARGVRLGTPWVSQRGMGPAEMDKIAGWIAKLVNNIEPFTYEGLIGTLPRGKIPLEVMEEVKREVAELTAATPAETKSLGSVYPHYYMMDGRKAGGSREVLSVWGDRARPFMQQVCTADVALLCKGDVLRSCLLDKDGKVIDDVFVMNAGEDARGWEHFMLAAHSDRAEKVKAWLRGLAEGYILFDNNDIYRKVEGPVVVADLVSNPELNEPAAAFLKAIAGKDKPLGLGAEASGAQALKAAPALFALQKTYFVGQETLLEHAGKSNKAVWSWTEPANAPVKRTCLYEEHAKRTRKIIPFAGWEMPVWYTSVSEEHRATRETAALYDVSHMGVLGITGPNAESFLDTISTNYVRWLEDGQSHYSYMLDPNGDAIDDIMIYRRARHNYIMVVNAANADKDWDWLNAVNEGRVVIDLENPSKTIEGPATLRNLKDPQNGADQKVDIALQGPKSLATLLRLADDERSRVLLSRMPRTDLREVRCNGLELVVARTGYTGEDVGFEIFVHPEKAPQLWNAILDAGKDLGVVPAGLGARDSTRTEAGLPLYGHEIAGPYGIIPMEAGFGSYVKLHKPFFIGRKPLIAKMKASTMQIVRFRMNQKGVRMPKTGDPVVNARGRCIGYVTSCSMDIEGYLIGLAIVERKQSKEGTEIGIFVLPEKPAAEKAKVEFKPGDSTLLPLAATIVPRFPNK